MSVEGSTFHEMWNPWGDLHRLVHIRLVLAHLPGKQTGQTCFATGTITIDPRLKQRERNDAMAHERVHLERGPAVAGFEDHEERVVEEVTARRLIPIGALVSALRWTRSPAELAEELHCTPETVLIRFATMKHPAERAAVQRVMDDVEHP